MEAQSQPSLGRVRNHAGAHCGFLFSLPPFDDKVHHFVLVQLLTRFIAKVGGRNWAVLCYFSNAIRYFTKDCSVQTVTGFIDSDDIVLNTYGGVLRDSFLIDELD